MRPLLLVLLACLLALAGPAARAAEDPASWSRPAEPFRVVGDVYYVGTEGISAFLVTGPEGHVLIDGGPPGAAPLIAAGIEKLGFRPRDVKVILINHAHFDHAGGLAALKRLTGARLAASAGDRPDLEAGRTRGRPELKGFPPVRVDRVIGDGDQVRVGPVVLTAILTPGHTPGATSWTTETGGKRVIFASSLTVAGEKLVGNAAYPDVVADFRRSLARLAATRADVFLNFHAEAFGLAAKRARQKAGAADAFVDPGELARQVAAARTAFDAELAKQTAAKGR
jgi:metallo-beta-lactamase class B